MFTVLSLPLVWPYLQGALPLAGLLAALVPLAAAWTWWRLRAGRGGKQT